MKRGVFIIFLLLNFLTLSEEYYYVDSFRVTDIAKEVIFEKGKDIEEIKNGIYEFVYNDANCKWYILKNDEDSEKIVNSMFNEEDFSIEETKELNPKVRMTTFSGALSYVGNWSCITGNSMIIMASGYSRFDSEENGEELYNRVLSKMRYKIRKLRDMSIIIEKLDSEGENISYTWLLDALLNNKLPLEKSSICVDEGSFTKVEIKEKNYLYEIKVYVEKKEFEKEYGLEGEKYVDGYTIIRDFNQGEVIIKGHNMIIKITNNVSGEIVKNIFEKVIKAKEALEYK